MAKQSGLGDRLWVGGYNLSGDIGALASVASPRATLPATDITMSGTARMHAHKDGAMEFQSYFNPTANQAHPRLSSLPTADVGCIYGRGAALGSPAACMIAKQIDYAPSRPQDGSFTFKTAMQANGYGLEWGIQHTAGERTDTAAGNGTAVDSGAAGVAFGLQAYLQVISFTGTSVVIKLQESSDNAGDAYADVTGGAFASVSAGRQTQRLQTSRTQTIERYLRVTTTGTFSECTFVVVVVRNAQTELF